MTVGSAHARPQVGERRGETKNRSDGHREALLVAEGLCTPRISGPEICVDENKVGPPVEAGRPATDHQPPVSTGSDGSLLHALHEPA